MIFKAILIALLVSVSLQREYHNGWKRWEQNCRVCNEFLEKLAYGRGRGVTQLQKDHFGNDGRGLETVCGKIASVDVSLCIEMLKIPYLFNTIKNVASGTGKKADEICRDPQLNLCPPTKGRSMYHTPEFPQLRLDNITLNKFNDMLASMDRFEF